MLLLLGGTARSGKSIIARRVLLERGIPFFCLDHLAHGAARAIPQLQIDLDGDDASVGERTWPLVRSVAEMIIKDRIDYLLEGALLRPRHARELLSDYPARIRACFTGYAEADVEQKFEQVRQFGGGPDDWMMRFDNGRVRSELERLKSESQILREECDRFQLHYFETSVAFDKSVSSVIKFLTSPSEAPLASR